MTFWLFVDKHFSRVRFSHIMAVLLSLGFLAAFFVLCFHGLPTANEKYILIMIPAITGAIGLICGFIWSSSAGSAKKDDAIIRNMREAG